MVATRCHLDVVACHRCTLRWGLVVFKMPASSTPGMEAGRCPRTWEAAAGLLALSPCPVLSAATVSFMLLLAATQANLTRWCCRSLVSSRPEDRGDILTGAQPRRPVAWLLLRPSHLGVPHQLPSQDLAVPICMDIMLPDFIVKQDAYDRGMTRLWQEVTPCLAAATRDPPQAGDPPCLLQP